MYLGLVEARYEYQMSYLDEWAGAWQRSASKYEVFNVVQNDELELLEKKLLDFDLIVVLHSVSADSNAWLKKIAHLSNRSRSPMILFVGNEFSSPFLSTELRLELINQISPEIVASQLPEDCSSWLYKETASRIVSAPPGMPNIEFRESDSLRKLDLGYRGFSYPWYLLDEERNQTITSVFDYFQSRNLRVDISYKHRLGRTQWFDFLAESRFTTSSEAGSRFVFRDDQIWKPVQEYFARQHKFSAIGNDVIGMSFLRKLPGPAKKTFKSLTSLLGMNQASLYKPDSDEIEILLDLIDTSKFEYRNGKCISSRHFDAVACGTWQVLKSGTYNGILESDEHFTSWDTAGVEDLNELIVDQKLTAEKARGAFESLRMGHTYDARVDMLIQSLR